MIILPSLLLSFYSAPVPFFHLSYEFIVVHTMEVEERCLKAILDTLACTFRIPETSLTWMVACSIVIMIPVSLPSFFPVPNIMKNTIFGFRLLLFHFICCVIAFRIKLPPASKTYTYTQTYSHF